jgi:hypothetical protein
MQREGQPRGIQSLFRSMKLGEVLRRKTPHQPRREPQRVNSLPIHPQPETMPSWENDPRLTQESKQAIRAELHAWKVRADQASKEYREMRANEPKGTPWTVNDWLAFREMKENERMKTLKPAPLVPEQLSPGSSTPEKGKGIATGMYTTLVKEVADMRMLKAGQILQKEVWEDDPNNPKATIRRYGDMRITISHKTGRVKDRSQVGYSLANPSEGTDVYYGIGYFENDENFIPVSRGSVSPEARKKGAKAYFIERTRSGRKELTVIPFAYAEALEEFYDRLYDTAVDLAPSHARHRRQAEQQPLAAAA